MLKARCWCGWYVKASGEKFLALATDIHFAATGHEIEVKTPIL